VIIRYLTWLVILTVFNVQLVLAQDLLSREQQRKVFIKAESLAYNPNSSAYKKAMKQLEGYPLKPYVELKTLRKFFKQI
jgi:soluble lytic murein transglycosylase